MQIYKPIDYYTAVCKYWDRMYESSIHYQKVFEFIDNLREKMEYPKEIADIACGTGLLLKYFKNTGYEVFGSDLNEGMLEQAKIKLPEVDLLRESYHEVELPKLFPMIISYFNSFAYCLDKLTLTSVLQHLGNQLISGGMIFFDLFVTENLKEEFGVKTYTFNDGTHISRTFLGYPENEKTYHTHFIYTIIEKRKPRTIASESLRGILSKNEINQSIKEAGFKIYYSGKNPGIPEAENSILYVGVRKN